MPETRDDKHDSPTEFARQASHKQTGFLREFWSFLIASKKWWLAPVILMLLVLGVIVILGSTPAAPFIYTLF